MTAYFDNPFNLLFHMQHFIPAHRVKGFSIIAKKNRQATVFHNGIQANGIEGYLFFQEITTYDGQILKNAQPESQGRNIVKINSEPVSNEYQNNRQ